jgi:hypothetical protein
MTKREYDRDGMELSTTTERYLVAMVTWVRQRVLYGIKVNPDNFTLEVAQEEAMKLTIRDEAINQSKDYKPPMPEKLRLPPSTKYSRKQYRTTLTNLLGYQMYHYLMSSEMNPKETSMQSMKLRLRG